MTEQEMLEELKTWDEEAWKKFKETQYETIEIGFKLTDEQATYILDMPLRRLTKMSKLELETEQKELKSEITKLKALLASEDAIKAQVSDELTEVSKNFGTPRRTKVA